MAHEIFEPQPVTVAAISHLPLDWMYTSKMTSVSLRIDLIIRANKSSMNSTNYTHVKQVKNITFRLQASLSLRKAVTLHN